MGLAFSWYAHIAGGYRRHRGAVDAKGDHRKPARQLDVMLEPRPQVICPIGQQALNHALHTFGSADQGVPRLDRGDHQIADYLHSHGF